MYFFVGLENLLFKDHNLKSFTASQAFTIESKQAFTIESKYENTINWRSSHNGAYPMGV
jgi:hypothetical protein